MTNTISKSVALVQATYNMSFTGYRVFLLALSKVNPLEPETAKREIRISLENFWNTFPTKFRGIKNVEKLAQEENTIILQTGEVIPAWKTCRFDNRNIVVQFSEEIQSHITNLQGAYVKFPLEEVRWYNSVSAIRLYEILTQWAKVGEKSYSIAHLQKIMCVHYKNACDFFRRALIPACKAVAGQGRFSVSLAKRYTSNALTGVCLHMAKIEGELCPTKRCLAWLDGAYTSKRKQKEAEEISFISAISTAPKKSIPDWLDEKIVAPVVEKVQEIADTLPDITPEPVMATPEPISIPTPAPAPATAEKETETTEIVVPDYVPAEYGKALTGAEIKKILGVFDAKGVYEHLRGEVLKKAWKIFLTSKDDVKTPANYIAGVVRNLLTKMGIDMPNIFGKTTKNEFPNDNGKYPRKIEWVDSPTIRKKGFLDYEPNFDVNMFDYEPPIECVSYVENSRYSTEVRRREKTGNVDMVSQIPINIYWRINDVQVNVICDLYQDAGATLEQMKLHLNDIYNDKCRVLEGVPTSKVSGDAVFDVVVREIRSRISQVAQVQPKKMMDISYNDFADQY